MTINEIIFVLVIASIFIIYIITAVIFRNQFNALIKSIETDIIKTSRFNNAKGFDILGEIERLLNNKQLMKSKYCSRKINGLEAFWKSKFTNLK